MKNSSEGESFRSKSFEELDWNQCDADSTHLSLQESIDFEISAALKATLLIIAFDVTCLRNSDTNVNSR